MNLIDDIVSKIALALDAHAKRGKLGDYMIQGEHMTQDGCAAHAEGQTCCLESDHVGIDKVLEVIREAIRPDVTKLEERADRLTTERNKAMDDLKSFELGEDRRIAMNVLTWCDALARPLLPSDAVREEWDKNVTPVLNKWREIRSQDPEERRLDKQFDAVRMQGPVAAEIAKDEAAFRKIDKDTGGKRRLAWLYITESSLLEWLEKRPDETAAAYFNKQPYQSHHVRKGLSGRGNVVYAVWNGEGDPADAPEPEF